MNASVSLQHTFRQLTDAFARCLQRFPVAVGFVWLLSIHLIYIVNTEMKGNDQWMVTLFYYLSAGTLLSLTLHLWEEEYRKRRTVWLVWGIAHALLLADACFLYHHFEELETGVGRFAIVGALIVSVFVLSFLREKDDVAAWNFARHTLRALILAVLTGGLMSGGICLLLVSLEQLFGVHISSKCYYYVGILCGLTLSAMLFLGLLPGGETKHDRRLYVSRFADNVLRWLLLPLLGAYIVVLYVYTARILVNWELPNGWVSWLVTALSAGSILLLCGLYPMQMRGNRHSDKLLVRWLPLLVLPLLILMTVGIARRFADYGLTINRLYLITFNIWLYVVFLGIYFLRGRRILWIPASFAAVFLLTSAFPVNYVNLTRDTLRRQVRTELTRDGQQTLPFTAKQYADWLNAQPHEIQMRVNEKLLYLEETFYNEKVYADLVEGIETFYNYNYNYICDSVAIDTQMTNLSAYLSEDSIPVPQSNYTRFVAVTCTGHILPDSLKHGHRLAIVIDQAPNDTVTIESSHLWHIACAKVDSARRPFIVPSTTGQRSLVVTRFWYTDIDSTLYVGGYLFFNDNNINH